MQTNLLCEKEKCFGCGACFAACSCDAIEMKLDSFGALYPDIKLDKCIGCKQCESVCPVKNYMEFAEPVECYAAYTKIKEDVETVSSGGVATTFGKYIISQEGVVFGINKNLPYFFHCAETNEEVNGFKGSKYVHVFPGKVYKKVKEKLLDGKRCLFVGTPCQIAGLKSFLKKEYEGLITVDLICHGVAPYSYLEQWLKSKVKDEINSISFRGKDSYVLNVRDKENKILYKKASSEDAYFYAFLNGLILRENCYSCPYARKERISDVTIGDFWGLDKSALNGYKGKKSLVIINTSKGKNFFEGTKSLLNFEKRDLEEALSKNDQLSFPSKSHTERDTFKKVYEEKGFCVAIKACGILKEAKRNSIRNFLLKFPSKLKRLLLDGGEKFK